MDDDEIAWGCRTGMHEDEVSSPVHLWDEANFAFFTILGGSDSMLGINASKQGEGGLTCDVFPDGV